MHNSRYVLHILRRLNSQLSFTNTNSSKKVKQHFHGSCAYISFIRCYSKAALCKEINEPLEVEDIKEKKLSKGEVKIKVNYCGLNHRDLLLLDGRIKAKAPFVPGYEVSGVIVEKAKGSDDGDLENPLEVGDKVVALTKSSLGGLSSHCIALEKDVWRFSSLEPKVAAALPVNYGLALLTLFRRAKIKKDMKVVITADSGGLGLAALDIAANVYKAKVVGVCGSEEKADLLRQLGAWSALKMDWNNMKATCKDITENKGVDIVYETVGGDFLKAAMHCVKHEGFLVLADLSLHQFTIDPADLFAHHTFNMTAVSLDHYRDYDTPVFRQAVADVIELCEQHLVKPHISKTVELKDVNEAVKMMKEDQLIGKVLVQLDD